MTVTVGILSDSHGVIDARIREHMNGCDHVIHAGDICRAEVLDQLQPKIALHAVAGNNDHPAAWRPAERDVVKTLPQNLRLELPGGLIIVEHGHRLGNHPDHDQFRWDHAEARLVIYGHTHKRIIDQSAEPWVINPGASGQTRTKGGPSCLILTACEENWELETFVYAEEKAA